ncbi:hypothetical protein [Methylobacterium dankookense]|uniref:Uncharacterized protein n=1 Tax=Methylobacterium dankookense TaxID=560405 RepID=A0A564G5K7_9HYPH|nr:hypothetical protein [Methylobacterium dankookense]GJD55201.1 hypothetical protein IFDJLNFL_1084 [Methylobacterium dankookense]VUF15220.1 hypothetical protein MTDSW087_04956 [Methylobacterium dankookense]
MRERYDFAAINERGVYALHSDDGSADGLAFVRKARARGHWVERLPVEEACERHIAYLQATWPAFAEVFARKAEASGIPVRRVVS